MEILESGPPGERRRSPLGGRLLIAALVVAVIAAIAVGEAHRRRPSAAPRPSPVVAGLVEPGSNVDYETDDQTFVLRLQLQNFNPVPVRVKAAAAPEVPGLSGLMLAVLDGDASSYAAVAAGAGRALSLIPNGTLTLAIAAHVVCGPATPAPEPLGILVEGEAATVVVPRINDKDWATAMKLKVCKTR